MNILRLIDSLDLRDGGPPAGVLHLDAALRARGHVTATFAMKRHGQSGLDDGAHVRIVPTARIAGRAISLRFFREVDRRAKTADVVVVHGFYLWHDLVGWRVARKYGLPLILMPHGVFEPYQRARSRRSKAVYDALVGRRIQKAVAGVAVASESEAERLLDLWAEPKVSVVGLGVPQGDTSSGSRAVHEPLRLLTLSRIAPKKRIDLCITALSHLRARGVEATLNIVGSGDPDLVQELQLLVAAEGVADHVCWSGHLEGRGKEAALAGSDVILLPSENENFAIAIAEALAVGLPAVVSEDVAMAKYVRQGAGLVAPPDGKGIADAVVRITSDPSSYAAMSRRALELAETELSWGAVALRWELLLDDAVRSLRGRTGA